MVGGVYILTMKTSIPKKQLTSPFFFFKHNAKIPKKKTVQRLWTKAYNTLVHFKTDTI